MQILYNIIFRLIGRHLFLILGWFVRQSFAKGKAEA